MLENHNTYLFWILLGLLFITLILYSIVAGMAPQGWPKVPSSIAITFTFLVQIVAVKYFLGFGSWSMTAAMTLLFISVMFYQLYLDYRGWVLLIMWLGPFLGFVGMLLLRRSPEDGQFEWLHSAHEYVWGGLEQNACAEDDQELVNRIFKKIEASPKVAAAMLEPRPDPSTGKTRRTRAELELQEQDWLARREEIQSKLLHTIEALQDSSLEALQEREQEKQEREQEEQDEEDQLSGGATEDGKVEEHDEDQPIPPPEARARPHKSPRERKLALRHRFADEKRSIRAQQQQERIERIIREGRYHFTSRTRQAGDWVLRASGEVYDGARNLIGRLDEFNQVIGTRTGEVIGRLQILGAAAGRGFHTGLSHVGEAARNVRSTVGSASRAVDRATFGRFEGARDRRRERGGRLPPRDHDQHSNGSSDLEEILAAIRS